MEMVVRSKSSCHADAPFEFLQSRNLALLFHIVGQVKALLGHDNAFLFALESVLSPLLCRYARRNDFKLIASQHQVLHSTMERALEMLWWVSYLCSNEPSIVAISSVEKSRCLQSEPIMFAVRYT